MSDIDKFSNKIVNAFLKNQFINPLPIKFTKNIKNANRFRKLCESKIKLPVIGFKAGGTGIALLKKLKEKEPFYATVYKKNLLKSGKSVKINKSTLGIELEVCFLIKKKFFSSSKQITLKNISKYIKYMAPCIEIVGYRQKKRGFRYLGDLCSDFGANFKFLVGPNKKFRKINFGNLKTNLNNKTKNLNTFGNTSSVYINPVNSCRFVLNKLRKDKIKLKHNFYVFTGSTIGVVPLKNKGLYKGSIDKLGYCSANIR